MREVEVLHDQLLARNEKFRAKKAKELVTQSLLYHRVCLNRYTF
jgi:hypothetical protein